MPKIGCIIFFNGVRFALTKGDAFFMQNVVAASRARGRPFSPVLADSESCIEDCFTIHTAFKQVLPRTLFKLIKQDLPSCDKSL
jgi:hypothetical protein